MVSACAAAFLLIASSQWQWRDIPAYHDALMHWDYARRFAGRPWFPFLTESDTGHPPLVAWTLGLLQSFGADPLLAMHLMSWGAFALLVGSVFGVARRIIGFAAGVCAALMTAMQPVVAAQALQFNLDLYMAAFAWLAVFGVASGRRWLVAVGLSLCCLSKLNGPFILLPFGLLGLCEFLSGPRSPRRLACACGPVAIALLAFLGYLLAKKLAVGHVLDSGEFVGGAQVTFAKSYPEYRNYLDNSYRMATKWNGNGFLMGVAGWLLLGTGARCLWTCWRTRNLPSIGPQSFRVECPPGAVGMLVLLWLIASSQVLLQSSRSHYTLDRYFIICFPALYITLAAACTWMPRRVGPPLMVLVTALACSVFALLWHPGWRPDLPKWIGSEVLGKPAAQRNYENSMEIVEVFPLLKLAARDLAELDVRGQVQAQWPLCVYLKDTAFDVSPRSFDAEHVQPAPEAIVEFSASTARKRPDEVPPPPGFEVHSVHEARPVWVRVVVRR